MPNPLLLIAAIACGVGSVLVLVRVPGLWKGSLDVEQALRSWWLWGPVSMRAVIRAHLAGWFSFVVGSTVVGLMLIAPNAPKAFWVTLAALWAGVAMLAISAALFARPNWIIAPRFRGQPGAVQEWWSNRRRSR